MVKFHIKGNRHGQYYLPKEVREDLGTTLYLVCDTKTAIIYSSSIPLECVIKSIKILTEDLQQRLELE